MDKVVTYKIKNPSDKNGGIFYFSLALFLSGVLLSNYSSAQASIHLLDSKKNFGFVIRGEILKLEFELINQGNQPLVIQQAEVACSCTSVEFDKRPIAPSQKTRIIVIFKTESVYGRQDRTVRLYSNDPKSPTLIRFKGFVKS